MARKKVNGSRRICAYTECDTVLSIYNKGDYCQRHDGGCHRKLRSGDLLRDGSKAEIIFLSLRDVGF